MNRKRRERSNKAPSKQETKFFEALDWQSLWGATQQTLTLIPLRHRKIILCLAVIVLLLLLLPSSEVNEAQEPTSSERRTLDITPRSLSEGNAPQVKEQEASLAWQEYTIASGDTLSRVFQRQSIPIADLSALINVEGTDKPLSRIKVGQLIRYKLDNEGRLDILQLETPDSDSIMFFRLSNGSFGRNK